MKIPGTTLLAMLTDALGTEVVKLIGHDEFADLARRIDAYQDRYAAETNPEEKRQLEIDIQCLESMFMSRIERKKLKISNAVEKSLRTAVASVMKTAFPFLG